MQGRASQRLMRTIELSPGSGRILLLVALLLISILQPGCSGWRAARLYQSGSRALEQGDAPGAVSDLERAAALKPGSSEIQNHLGIAYEMEGRRGLALAAFQRAADLDCDNEAAQRNLAAFGVGGAPSSEGEGSDRPSKKPQQKTLPD